MGLRDFQGAMKKVFSFQNLLLLSTFGLFTVEIIIQLLTKWFGVDVSPFFARPYIIIVLAATAIFLALAIIRGTWSGIFTSKSAVALIIIASLMIGLLLLKFSGMTDGTWFEASARAARVAVNMP